MSVIQLEDTLWLTPTIVEDNQNGIMVIEGTFQLSDTKNANRRAYPRKLWERIIGNENSDAMQLVKVRGMLGHLEHPKDGVTKIHEVAHVVTGLSLSKDGKVIGRAELLDTPSGKIAQECVRKKIRMGISSRGSGSVNAEGIVQEDYQLSTFDLVYNPSTVDAFPKQVKEDEETTNTITKPILEKGDTKMSLDKFKAIEVRVRPLIEQDITTLQPYQLSEVSSKLLDAVTEVSEVAGANAGLTAVAASLIQELSAARSKIVEAAKTKKVDSKDVTTKIEDKVTENEAELLEEITALKTLLSAAKDRMEDLEKDFDASVKLSEGLVSMFHSKVDEARMEITSSIQEDDEVSEKYGAALAIISELSSTKEDTVSVVESIEDVIESIPALESARNLFEGCTSSAEVESRARSILSLTEHSNSIKSDASRLPVGMLVESENDIIGDKGKTSVITESSSKSVKLAHQMLK